MSVPTTAWPRPLPAGDEPVAMLIDGDWVSPSAATTPVFDPSTGDVIANVPDGGAEAVDTAVAAARRSFDEGRWRGLSGTERGAVLWRAGDLMRERADDLASLESLNL